MNLKVWFPVFGAVALCGFLMVGRVPPFTGTLFFIGALGSAVAAGAGMAMFWDDTLNALAEILAQADDRKTRDDEPAAS